MSRSDQRKQINIDVGNQIRKHRETAGLSREAFSEQIGISPRFCSSLENGFVGISLTTLRAVCEFFGVSADAILWTDRSSAARTAEQLEAILAGVEPEMMPLIVNNIRGQVKLIKLAQAKSGQTKKGPKEL